MTVPLDAILDEGDHQSQVVQVEVPVDGSQPVPQVIYKSPTDGHLSQDEAQGSEQSPKVMAISRDMLTKKTENVNESNKIQVVIREADEHRVESVSSAIEEMRAEIEQSNGSGASMNVKEDTVVVGSNNQIKSNLNEHDYLAAKKPAQQQVVQVSRRSKRKAAMSPQRKRGDGTLHDSPGNKVARKEVVSTKEMVASKVTEETETIDALEKLASGIANISEKIKAAEMPSENAGTTMVLRKKKVTAVPDNGEQKDDTTPQEIVENSDVVSEDKLSTDAETSSQLLNKSTKKCTKKPVVKRERDAFTITPDGIEDMGPDEGLPINIIKASKPKDVSSFSAELALSVNTKFECVCGQKFTQKKSLIRHFRRKKARADGLQEEGSEHYSKYPIAIYPNTKAPRTKPVQKSFPCPHCPKVLQTKAGMDYHIMNHTGFKPVVCSLCGESFKSKQVLDQHFVIHSQTNELPHKCDKCGRTYLTATRLRAHMKIHEERKFRCHLCPHSFVMAKDLRKHMRVHTGEKPFECNFCEERFHFSQDVKRHLKRFHGDKAPFTCSQCPKPLYFFKEEEYTTHMRLHSDDSEFRCDICLQNFPTYTTLRNHQMTHGNKNPFQCRYKTCGQVFKCANDRYLHERKVHDTNLLYCKFCKLSFKRPSNFEEHQRKHLGPSYECRADTECKMKFQEAQVRLRHEKNHNKSGSQRPVGVKKKKADTAPRDRVNTPAPATVYQCGI